jgi:hypothetical protein
MMMMNDDEFVATVQYLAGKTEVLGEKLSQCLFA